MPTTGDTPQRLISVKVEPKTVEDQLSLPTTLQDLIVDDPKSSFTIDAESGETVIRGISELHLDRMIGKLLDRGIALNVGHPQVEYREVLRGLAEVEYTYSTQRHGIREFARVTLCVEPIEAGSGNQFVSNVASATVPEAYIAAVAKGVASVWENGVLIGFPIVEVKVTLCDVGYDKVSSSAVAFEAAARAAMKDACKSAGIHILEPIMDIEVVTPADAVGALTDHLIANRAFIRAQEDSNSDNAVIRADMPLAQMFGIKSRLDDLSGRRARYRVSFSHYDVVPSQPDDDPGTFPPAIGMRA